MYDEFCEFLENFAIIPRIDENGDLYFIDMENEVAMAASYENHIEQNEIKFENFIYSGNIKIEIYKCSSDNSKTINKGICISSLGIIYYFSEDGIIHAFKKDKFEQGIYDEKMTEELLSNRVITIFSEYYRKTFPELSLIVKKAKSCSRLNVIK